MRLTGFSLALFLLCLSAPALAQDWTEFSNQNDRFSVNVAGQPQVQEITWKSEYGMTVDSEGRLYVTGGPGVHVIAADGKYLGVIPTPPGVITAAFSGRDKKTLYAVISLRVGDTRDANIISIPMLAQGYKGRAK